MSTPVQARDRAGRLPGQALSDGRHRVRRRGGRVRRYAAELVASFEEHDLLTSASAISFQIFTAIVPFLLFAGRWGLAGGLMLLAVGLLMRHAPAKTRPMQWVSFGTLLIIGSWIVMSLAFGGYLRFVASYQSVFGNLATVVVLLGYIYLSSVVFLAGAQLDALVRRRVEGA